MEFVLSGNAVKRFACAITCLGSIGDYKLLIQANSSQIVFNTINSGSTACQWITLKRDFFDDYNVHGSEVGCSVDLKEVCSVLMTPITNINTLSVRMTVANAYRIRWTLLFTDGTTQSYRTKFKVEPYVRYLDLDTRMLPSDLIVRPQNLNRLLAKLQSSIPSITIIATDQNSFPANEIHGKVVELRSYDPTKDNDSSFPTRLWIDPLVEFVQYFHSRDPVDVTFAVKDLKAFVAFCEACEADIHLYFDKAGTPILMEPQFKFDDGCSSNFDSTLMLGTIGLSQLHGGQTSEPSFSDHATENVSDHTKIQSDISGSDAENGLPFYFKHFDHVSTLGEGCFGAVHLARHKLDKKLFAIKIIKFKSEEYCGTRREVEIMASVDHEHIVRYHQSWIDYGLDLYCNKELEEYGSEYEEDDGDEENTGDDDDEGDEEENEADSGEGDDEETANDDDEGDGEEEDVADEDEEEVAGNEEEVDDDGNYEAEKDAAGDKQVDYSFLCIQMTLYPRTLYDCVRPRKYSFNEELAAKWFMQMVKGVAYLHELNIAHGDLKPQNVLIDTKNNIKIGDFGLAIKINYPGPQLIEGLPLPDKKGDMLELGITLFRLYHPFTNERHEAESIGEMRKGKVRDKGWLKKYLARWALIKRLTSRRKARRPSASQVLEELELMENG